MFSIVNCALDLTAIVAQWRNSKQEKVCSEILRRLVKWCCTAGKQCKPTDFALQATLLSPIYIYFRVPLKVTPQLFSITANFLCSSSFPNIIEIVVIFWRILIKSWIELNLFCGNPQQMNRSHSQTMILVFKICKSHLRAFTSTVIKAQTTQWGAKSLGRDAFPVFRVISSCSGKQQRAIDQRLSHYYYTPNTSQTPLCIV